MHGHHAFMCTVISHQVECGCRVLLFTGVGEWVVSSKNGTKYKVETHDGVN